MPPEFSIRTNSVDVEQIMKQIRARIRDKRGVDYTEAEIRELANIKLEKFLDPSRVRSELLEHYRQGRPSPSAAPISVPPAPPNYEFEAETPYLSSRGAFGRTLYAVRRLLNPILKLFINPTPVIHVLHMQSAFNRESSVRFDRFLEQWQEREGRRTEMDALGYEVAHNLVVEMTRLGIEVKNLKMRVESLSSRLEFSERRARALESIVQYRPGAAPGGEPPSRPPAGADERRRDERRRDEPRREEPRREERRREERPAEGEAGTGVAKGEAQRSRRKRRRRGRGTGQSAQSQGAQPADLLAGVDDPEGGPGNGSAGDANASHEREAEPGTVPASAGGPETGAGPGPDGSGPSWPGDPDSPDRGDQ